MRFTRYLTPRTIAAAVAASLFLAVFGPTFVAPRSGLLPPPSDSSAQTTPETTTTVDYSGAVLPLVAGTEAAEPLVERGKSSVHGSVDVPEGRLPGATVRLERLVGDQVQRIDVPTAADGTFTVANIPGGRYRVRAWLAPIYTTPEPEIFFLVDGDDRELHLRAEELQGIVVRAATRPEAPYLGQGVNISVWVADRVVDPDGISREQGRPGVRVALSVNGLTDLAPGAVRTTDESGTAVFEFSCDRVASVSVTALVGAAAPSATQPPAGDTTTTTTTTTAPGPDVSAPVVVDEVVSLEVPDCMPVPTTTTTTTEPADGDDTAESTEPG